MQTASSQVPRAHTKDGILGLVGSSIRRYRSTAMRRKLSIDTCRGMSWHNRKTKIKDDSSAQTVCGYLFCGWLRGWLDVRLIFALRHISYFMCDIKKSEITLCCYTLHCFKITMNLFASSFVKLLRNSFTTYKLFPLCPTYERLRYYKQQIGNSNQDESECVLFSAIVAREQLMLYPVE